MRFPAGNAGFVVVIAAVLGTVLIGYVLTVDTSTETATEFEQTADITGLFTISTEPEYLEYSPPENWTGFRTGSNYWMSGIDYEASVNDNNTPRATPYIVPQQDRTAVSNGQVTGDTIGVTSALWLGTWVSTPVNNPKLVQLETIVNDLALGDDITKLEIWTETGGPIITGYDVEYQAVAPFNKYLAYDPDTRHVIIDLNDVNKRTVLYDSNGTLTSTLALADIGVFYDSSAGYTDDFTYQGIRDLPLIYLDARQGVAVSGGDVVWSNGYDNSKLTVVVERPGSLYFEIDLTNGEGLAVTVGAAAVNISNYGGTPINFAVSSAWDHFALQFDFKEGSVTFLPIISWTDFTTFETTSGTTYYQAVTGVADKITFHSMASNARFGIADTWVYLDTSQIVFSNPSITITDYWPDVEGRVQFNGFAMYGDTLTMNNQSFAVSDGLITAGQEQFELSDLTITYMDGSATATIGKHTIDLGPITDYAISFGGIWYFTASYWKAVDVDKTVFDWKTGEFGLTSSACIAAYLGILVLGTAILHRSQNLQGGDLLIIACAGVVGFVLMDVMI